MPSLFIYQLLQVNRTLYKYKTVKFRFVFLLLLLLLLLLFIVVFVFYTAGPTSNSSAIAGSHGSFVGHPASPTPMKVPALAVIVSLFAVVLIIIALSLTHFVRER